MQLKKFKRFQSDLKVLQLLQNKITKKKHMQLHGIRPLLAFSFTLAFNAPRDGWCDGCGGGGWWVG